MPDASRLLKLRYGVAVLAVVAALILKLSLSPLVALEARFLFLIGAVLLSAWYGGLGPGLLATGLSALLANPFPPVAIWPPWFAPSPGLPVMLFVLEGLLISLLGARLHAALGRGETANPETARRHEDPEGEPAAADRLTANEQPAAESARVPVEFVSSLSHDLRSPLNAILGWVQLRRGGSLDHETEARAWQAIERSARDQARLIDDLLKAPRQAADRPTESAPPAGAQISGLRLLIVDDEPDAREMLCSMLDRCGAEVLCCGSAREALAMLQQWRPDALVSDLGMPGEDGYALIAKIRALAPERGGRVPAIALSGFTQAEDQRHALSAGFQIFLPKPVEQASLLAAVAAIARHDEGSGIRRNGKRSLSSQSGRINLGTAANARSAKKDKNRKEKAG
jgi:CheY-like chemotaxis protein